MHKDSPAWVAYTHIAFAAAFLMMAIGIWSLPAETWVKGYFSMGLVFLIGSTFTLSKTLRDQFEARKLVNRIDEAKTERLLKGLETEA